MSEPGYHEALRLLCQDAGADLHRVLAVACIALVATTWKTPAVSGAV